MPVRPSRPETSHRPRRTRPVAAAAGALATGAALTLVGAAPAEAATWNLGARSCSAGGVATQADANLTVVHTAWAGDLLRQRVFESSSIAYRVTTFYTGRAVITSSNVSNGGGIRSARIFCDY